MRRLVFRGVGFDKIHMFIVSCRGGFSKNERFTDGGEMW